MVIETENVELLQTETITAANLASTILIHYMLKYKMYTMD